MGTHFPRKDSKIAEVWFFVGWDDDYAHGALRKLPTDRDIIVWFEGFLENIDTPGFHEDFLS